MSVNSYLNTLDSDIKVSDSEEDKIDVSLYTIKSRLTSYFGSDVTEKKVFGSYDRKTILSRKSDDDSDVDLMVVFKNTEGYKPQSFLNRLKSFAEYYYSTSEIYQSSPTIVLELQHIKFELTPAYVSYETYYIPNGPSNWMSTDPDKLRDTVNESNRNNNYKLKPVLRLLKHWNVNKNYGVMASYSIEQTVASDLKYKDLNWACGWHLDDDERKDISKWRGKNLLGFALMEVREQIRDELGEDGGDISI